MQPRLTLFLCAYLFSTVSFAANTLAYTAPQPTAPVNNPINPAPVLPAPASPPTPVASVAPAVSATPVAPVAAPASAAPANVAAPVVVAPANKRMAAAKLPVAATPGMQTVTATSSKPISDEKDKVSYAIGVDMGVNLKAQNIAVNPEMLATGLKDALAGNQTLVSQQEIANTLANLQKQIITKREADFKAQAEQNKRTGEAFLQLNKTKAGVVTLPSGLQYKVVTQGNGIQPTDKDTVTVNYVGTLLNGQEFDSSYRRGKPVTFPVAEMIPGWAEALRLMKAGSTWDVYVPANLAYGERGLPGGPIGPNQTLAFKINLISVVKK